MIAGMSERSDGVYAPGVGVTRLEIRKAFLRSLEPLLDRAFTPSFLILPRTFQWLKGIGNSVVFGLAVTILHLGLTNTYQEKGRILNTARLFQLSKFYSIGWRSM